MKPATYIGPDPECPGWSIVIYDDEPNETYYCLYVEPLTASQVTC